MSNLLVVKDKVSRYARELFSQVLIDTDGDLKIPYESTVVYIRVIERFNSPEGMEYAEKFNLSKTLVRCSAPVIVGVKPSNELYKWIATKGQKFYLGSFLVEFTEEDESECEVWFQAELAGDELDQGELNTALALTADVADDHDEELQKLFGGRRVADL